MRDHYDFSKAKKNPYIQRLKIKKKPITINIDVSSIEYFKSLSSELSIPYQILINMYLADCVNNHRKLKWG